MTAITWPVTYAASPGLQGVVDAAMIARRLPTVPERLGLECAFGWLASRP